MLKTKFAFIAFVVLALVASRGAVAQEDSHAGHDHANHEYKSILDDLTPAERENYTSQTLLTKLTKKKSGEEKEWNDLGEKFKGFDVRLGTRSDALQKGDKVLLHTRIYTPAGDILVNSFETEPTSFYIGYNHEFSPTQVEIERMIDGMKAGGKRIIITPSESKFAQNLIQGALTIQPDLSLNEDDSLIVEALVLHVRRPEMKKKFNYQ